MNGHEIHADIRCYKHACFCALPSLSRARLVVLPVIGGLVLEVAGKCRVAEDHLDALVDVAVHQGKAVRVLSICVDGVPKLRRGEVDLRPTLPPSIRSMYDTKYQKCVQQILSCTQNICCTPTILPFLMRIYPHGHYLTPPGKDFNFCRRSSTFFILTSSRMMSLRRSVNNRSPTPLPMFSSMRN
jgi:hypothetical protein